MAGNVRQLENTCYWLALMAPSKDIQPSDLPQDILDGKVLNPSSDDWRMDSRLGLMGCMKQLVKTY